MLPVVNGGEILGDMVDPMDVNHWNTPVMALAPDEWTTSRPVHRDEVKIHSPGGQVHGSVTGLALHGLPALASLLNGLRSRCVCPQCETWEADHR